LPIRIAVIKEAISQVSDLATEAPNAHTRDAPVIEVASPVAIVPNNHLIMRHLRENQATGQAAERIPVENRILPADPTRRALLSFL
jgi:hypothetical protein